MLVLARKKGYVAVCAEVVLMLRLKRNVTGIQECLPPTLIVHQEEESH